VLSRFRSALTAGQRPRIEDYLPDWKEPGHSALLRGLVTLEVAYRLRHAEQPTTAEYRVRFPGQEPAVEDAFRHPVVATQPGPAGQTPGAATNAPAPGDDIATDRLPPLDIAAAPSALAADSGAARRFGDYELLEKIGRDELGVLYRARQLSVDRIVALKLIMTDGPRSDAMEQQFHLETRAVAALDHPGIVPIFDFGQHEGQYFVSTGFIEGETLAKRRVGGLGLREGVEVLRQVAEAIAFAHSKGVAHRNVTPRNILLNARGRPRLTGFSSAAPLPAEGTQSTTVRVMGTPGYLAPEQAREGQEVGPAADIHALGAVLYFILTGEPPFRGANLVETLLKVLHRDPRPPQRLNPSVPPELEAICLKCLRKRPGQRYATAAELAEDLGRWLRNEQPAAPVESPVSRSIRLLAQLALSHSRVSLGTAGSLGAILVGLAILTTFRPTPQKPERPGSAQAPAGDPGAPRRDEGAGRQEAVSKGADPGAAAGSVIVTKGKQATALVQVDADGRLNFGSAFCIDASGVFVTAAHVVAPAGGPNSRTVRLVLHAGELGQKVVPAQVIRSDADLDLAVLKLNTAGEVPLVRLELGRDAGLAETAVVTAFGYPLVTESPHLPGRYPGVSVNVGRITALPRSESGLSRIQLDAALNPGNSGGPVLDGDGKVVGVVAASLRGAAGMNYAIPVDQLTRYLAAPEVVFDPPSIHPGDRAQPVVWMIELRPPMLGSIPPEAVVALRLRSGTTGREAKVTKLGEGRYQAEVVPLPDGPIELKVTVGGETFQGRAADRTVKVGGATYALSQLSGLRRLDAGPRFRVLTATGTELAESVEGLGPVELNDAGRLKPLDLSTASAIQVRPQATGAIEAIVEVKAGSTVLATAKRELAFVEPEGLVGNPGVPQPAQAPRQAAPAVAAADRTAPRVDAKAQPIPAEIRLAGEIDDLAIGGDRYLVLALQSPAKLLVFDAAAATITKEVPLSGKAFVAAGSKTFVVVAPDQGVFQAWDFATLTVKKEETLVLSSKARIEGIAMGSRTEGPLLVVWDVEPPANRADVRNAFSPFDPRVRAGLIDPESFKFIKIGGFALDGPAPFNGPPLVSKDRRWFVPNPNLIRFPGGTNFPFQVRASARGDLFTISAWNGAALVANWEARSSRSIHCFNRFGGHQALIPAPEGRRVFTGQDQTIRLDPGGLTDRQGSLPGWAATPGAGTMLFPTEEPAYYVQFERDRQTSASVISILLPTGEVLLKEPVQDPASRDRNHGLQIMHDNKARFNGRRVLLFPEHELVVLIPNGENRLLPRRIALRDALGRLDHPVVISPSDLFAARGQTFSHQLRVLPKAGGLTYSVGKGFAPANLSVSEDGKVTWPVPPKYAGKEATAVIRVKDATGREVPHRLNILVR
jgi:serine/threonine protein kinase